MNAFLKCLDCGLIYQADKWICPRCYKRQDQSVEIRKILYDKNNKKSI